MTLESAFLVPPRERWRAFSSHERNATASPCCVIWNCFFEQSTTACSISWGLTCALKFLGFHSFLISSPNLCVEK